MHVLLCLCRAILSSLPKGTGSCGTFSARATLALKPHTLEQ